MNTFIFGWALDFGQNACLFVNIFFYAYKLPFTFSLPSTCFCRTHPPQLLGRDVQDCRFDLKPGVANLMIREFLLPVKQHFRRYTVDQGVGGKKFLGPK